MHLKTLGLKYGIIDGTVNPKHRMDLVEDFNTNPKGPQVTCNYSTELQQQVPLFTNPAMNFICHLCVCVSKVMLVSLCAGGVGLNLIGGNHLFLIDMHWSVMPTTNNTCFFYPM